MRRYFLWMAVVAALSTSCSGSDSGQSFPQALYGTWSGKGEVSKLDFSDGGRVSITFSDGSRCSGSYSLRNYAESEATISISLGTYGCPKDPGGFALKTLNLTGSAQMQVSTAETPPLSKMLGGSYTRQ